MQDGLRQTRCFLANIGMVSRKVDLVVERQWYVGMHARALTQTNTLGNVYGGFPSSRYHAQRIDPFAVKTFPWPALWNYGASRFSLPSSLHLDEGKCLAHYVQNQSALSPYVACYATAYRYLFPSLRDRGHILILERGSTHPENYFHQIEKAKREAGLPWTDCLPISVKEEINAGKMAHFIGAGSRMIAESYVQRGYAADRLLLAPWCTDVDFFSYRQRSWQEGKELRLVCVGMVGLRKGLGRLIRIARWAERKKINLKILLVGPLEKEASSLLAQSPRSVEWLGVQKGCKLRQILHEADLYILPSYEEGFGISILEAMSTGLPAVVSSETGGKEAIRTGENGLILSSFDDESLDMELWPLLNNHDLRLAMGQKARVTVEEHYTEAHYQALVASEYDRMFQLVDKLGQNLCPAWQGAMS